MTNGRKTEEVVHAANSRGIKYCGSVTSGDARANVAKYPERWSQVTCPECKELKDA